MSKPTIDPTDAPEGMVAVAANSNGLCTGCHNYKLYLETGICPEEESERMLCQSQNRTDGVQVRFRAITAPETEPCPHCAAKDKELSDMKTALTALADFLNSDEGAKA